jgi:PAS domain S-box-containing protein
VKTKSREGELLALKNLLAGEMAERRALEKMLRASSTRFDEFFYAAPVGLALLDHELRYVSVNNALARINGLPAGEHRGKAVAEVVPSIAPLVETAIRGVLQTGRPVLNLEVSGEGADGAGRWLLSFVPLDAEGGGGVGAVVLDFYDRARPGEAAAPPAAGLAAIHDRPASAIQLGRLIGDGSVGAGLGFLKALTSALAAAAEFLEQSRGDDAAEAVDVSRGVEFYDEVSRFETNLICRALRQTGGNQKRAAELLGMRPNTLSAMIHRHGINADDFKS